MKKQSRKSIIMTCSFTLLFMLSACGKGPGSQADGAARAAIQEITADVTDTAVCHAAKETGPEEISYYYYNCLQDREQSVYRSILDALQGFNEETEPIDADEGTVMEIFQYVMDDHPELFYISGYSMDIYTMGEKKSIRIQPAYTMARDEAVERAAEIHELTDHILTDIGREQGDYSVAKRIYEYVIESTDYEADSPDNQNICSVFLNGKSVCAGYAKAVQYLMQKAGMETAVVSGTVTNGESHAWNLALINGDYYYIDPTWGDASYRQEETGRNVLVGINYDYFCITTEQLAMTHGIAVGVPVPECTAVKDNYYIREGLYFTSIDKKQLAEAFGKAGRDGCTSVSLHCSDREVYEAMCGHLLEKEKIFKYMHTSGSSLMYAINDRLCTLTFWVEAA